MMIIRFANKGNLRSRFSDNFNSIFWIDKISLLYLISEKLHDGFGNY
jgi:hypothetical protein